MNAVGIGDLHLTSSVGKGGLAAYIKDHDAMVARAVTRVLAWGRERGIKRCLMYGDVCEGTRMSYDAMRALISVFRNNQDFKFEIILGNHDLFAEDPALGHSLQIIKEFAFDNVRIHEEPSIKKIDGCRVKFLPWPHADFDADCLNVAHVDVAGAKTDSGRPVSKGSSSTAVAVIGHIHTRQKVRNTHYSGTLYQTTFGESPQKSFHHIEYDDGWRITEIPFVPEYRLHSLKIAKRRDLLKIPDSQRTKKDLYKLVLLDGCELKADDVAGLHVVSVKSVNTAQELALAKVEELAQGTEVEISSDEFFDAWLEQQHLEPKLHKATRALRMTILKERDK